MSKKLAFWISLFTAAVLILSTGIYYNQSKNAIISEIENRADELLYADRRTVLDFLKYMRIITYGLYQNRIVTDVIKGDRPTVEAEDLFMRYCEDIKDIQAIRLVGVDGRIKVFIRECKNLSGSKTYKPIDISFKDFIERGARLKKPDIILSRFERGFLPDTTKFCPSMLRTIIPYFKGSDKSGYLVVNFWGEKVGGVVNRLRDDEGYSFIAEVNNNEPERDGIFLFHKDKNLEFANQLHHKHRIHTEFGAKVYEILKTQDSGLIHLEENNYLGFTTIYPYESKDVSWKVSTVLKGDYAFRNLVTLKKGFIAVMIISILMAVVVSFLFAKQFMRPIVYLKTALDSYGKGDLDYELEGVYTDEMADIADSVRRMASSLKKHMLEIDENRRKVEMIDRLSSLSILSAGVAHELATPLNSILIACSIYEKEKGSENEEVTTIKLQAERCVEIIESMKRLMADGYESCEIENVRLDELIDELVRFIHTGSDININLNLDEISVRICRSLLSQALLNLLINAVDAVHPSGNINIRVFREKGKAVIIIADDGEGMDSETLKKVFNPFYTTKSPEKGTGLGLSIAHKIVTEHGGSITVESEKDKGTSFRVEIDENSNS